MKKWRLVVVVIVVIIVALVITLHHKKQQRITIPAVPVTVASVQIKTIPRVYKTTGTLFASQQATIMAKTAGYVQAIYFKEGDFVKPNQVLVQLDTNSESDALAAARATAALSKLKYKSNYKLYKQHYIAPQTLDALQTAEKTDQATVDSDETNLKDKTLTAPFSGFIGAKTISVGDYIAPGTRVANLVDTAHLKISYTMPALYMSSLKLGEVVHLTSADSKLIGVAHVSYISPTIATDSQTLTLHATFNNKQQAFKPGQLVNISQPIGMLKNAILVPQASVITDISGDKVYIVKDHHAKAVLVTLGERVANKVIVTKGLTANSKVVTLGQNLLKDGSKVVVTP